MLLGKIVKSNAHTDYVCQIYGPGEVETAPSRDDHCFGTFVRIPLDNARGLVGLVYDTVLLNPEYGRFGPRLSPESELAVFSPDYLREKVVLVGIAAIGLMTVAGQVKQGVPLPAAYSDAFVERLADTAVRTFHQSGKAVQLDYLPLLLTLNTPLAVALARTVIRQLVPLFPGQEDTLSVLQRQLTWQTQITPLGGQ